jgi:hypothetical protein
MEGYARNFRPGIGGEVTGGQGPLQPGLAAWVSPEPAEALVVPSCPASLGLSEEPGLAGPLGTLDWVGTLTCWLQHHHPCFFSQAPL